MGNILKIYKWYRRHELLQWLLFLTPLWLQPIHMIGMGEMVGNYHNMLESTNIAHFSLGGDILLLLIDHLEWVSIVVGTEKFISWLRERKR